MALSQWLFKCGRILRTHGFKSCSPTTHCTIVRIAIFVKSVRLGQVAGCGSGGISLSRLQWLEFIFLAKLSLQTYAITFLSIFYVEGFIYSLSQGTCLSINMKNIFFQFSACILLTILISVPCAMLLYCYQVLIQFSIRIPNSSK